MQFTSARIMKALSVVLLIMAAIGLVMGGMNLWQVGRADDSDEGRAFLETLRQQMAEELGLPLEEPPPVTPAPEVTAQPEGTAPEATALPGTSPAVEASPLADAAPTAPPEPEGVRTEDVINYFSFIATLSIIDAVLQLLAGIIGLLRWNKPEKQVLPIVIGALMLVWGIIRFYMTGISAQTIAGGVMTCLLPAAFIWAAVTNRQQRKPSLW